MTTPTHTIGSQATDTHIDNPQEVMYKDQRYTLTPPSVAPIIEVTEHADTRSTAPPSTSTNPISHPGHITPRQNALHAQTLSQSNPIGLLTSRFLRDGSDIEMWIRDYRTICHAHNIPEAHMLASLPTRLEDIALEAYHTITLTPQSTFESVTQDMIKLLNGTDTILDDTPLDKWRKCTRNPTNAPTHFSTHFSFDYWQRPTKSQNTDR